MAEADPSRPLAVASDFDGLGLRLFADEARRQAVRPPNGTLPEWRLSLL
ncbi:hypothetical protein ABGB18_18830 [Nonomuraea sp. B12E4]